MPATGKKYTYRDRRNELPRLCIALSPTAMARLRGRAQRLQVSPQALIRTLLATGLQPDVPPVFAFPALERAAVASERMEERLIYLTSVLLSRIADGEDLSSVILALQGLQPEIRHLRLALDIGR
jgi:hypothetical protein